MAGVFFQNNAFLHLYLFCTGFLFLNRKLSYIVLERFFFWRQRITKQSHWEYNKRLLYDRTRRVHVHLIKNVSPLRVTKNIDHTMTTTTTTMTTTAHMHCIALHFICKEIYNKSDSLLTLSMNQQSLRTLLFRLVQQIAQSLIILNGLSLYFAFTDASKPRAKLILFSGTKIII